MIVFEKNQIISIVTVAPEVMGAYLEEHFIIPGGKLLSRGYIMPELPNSVTTKCWHLAHAIGVFVRSSLMNVSVALHLPTVKCLDGVISLGREKAHEMREGAFPDAKLELVHQVRGEHLITVEGGV